MWTFCPSQTWTDLRKLLVRFHSSPAKSGWSLAPAQAEVRSGAENHTAGVCLITGWFCQPFRLIHLQVQIDSGLVLGWATGLTQMLEETRGHFLFQCVLTAAWVLTWFPEPGNSSKGDTMFLWNHFDFGKFVTEYKLSSVSNLKFQTGFFGSNVLFCFFRKFSWFYADYLSAPQQWNFLV